MSRRLIEKGYTAPRFQSVAHPRGSEAEAINRLAIFAELLDQPIMVFHVSTAEGAAVVRNARGRGLKLFAETCPQYLLLSAADLDRPGNEGAKWICSPPLRTTADHDALWLSLALGDLQTVSSDHAPFAFDDTGKLRAGPTPGFKDVPNGLPGLEMRLPLMFDAMVSRGRLGLNRFVELTSTAPARIYNLHPRKGSIAIGADADICIWDPSRRVDITDETVHDRTGYTPYAGRTVTGWPETVISRGRAVARNGKCLATPGTGLFLPRTAGASAIPTGRLTADMDPSRNHGAQLI